MDFSDYFDADTSARIKALAHSQPTPFLAVSLGKIEENYRLMEDIFPGAGIYYAVKANPANEVLSRLRDLGSSFDVASIYELDKLLELGVPADRVSFGNTIKKGAHVRYCFEKGVRLFASDSEMDIRSLAENAPGADVFIRILTEGSETADWPLSRKFGCQPDMAIELMVLAKELGLRPMGISFHVGSQQRETSAWDAAIAKCKFIADRLKAHDIQIELLNLGGGLPANYDNKTHDLDHYARQIIRYLEEDFGDKQPRIVLEPGRSLVGDAGVLVSEVILVSRKSRDAVNRWVFADVGLFGGLIETLGEAIRYPLVSERDGELEECVIAGPTCDSMDIMYEDQMVMLPLSLEAGDKLYWLATGAYTTSYSSVEFNGFPPLAAHFID